MAWGEFRKTKTGLSKKWNKKKNAWEKGAWYAIGRHPETGERLCEAAGALENLKGKLNEVEKIELGEVDTPAKARKVTLGQALDKYREHMDSAFEPRTREAYKWGLLKMEAHFGRLKPIAKIVHSEFMEFLDCLRKSHSVNGVRDIAKTCSAFFSFSIKRGLPVANPVKGALGEKAYKEKLTERYYNDGEARHIIRNCAITRPKPNSEFQDIVRVAINAGLRQGEIPVLKTAWIYNGYINLPREMTKGDKPRKVPIHQKWLMPILVKYMIPGQELLFPGWNRQRIQTAWRRSIIKVKKAKHLTGRCRFHDLRHTYASNFLRDGGKIEDLQVILGHSSIVTTMRYVHFQEDHTKGPVNNMKNLFMEEEAPQLVVV